MKERYIGYKIKLFPTDEQKERIIAIANTFRYCYNLGLDIARRYRNEGKSSPNYIQYNYEFQALRKSEEYKWLLDFPLSTCENAFKNVQTAFKNFFAKRCRYPKYKSRKRDKLKFHTRDERLKFSKKDRRYVHIEGIKDYIFCGDHNIPIGPAIKYVNAYVYFDYKDFWLSLSVKFNEPIEFEAHGEPLGIDLGVRKMITLSNGEWFKTPDVSKIEKKMKRIDRRMVADVNRRFDQSVRTRTKYDDIPKSKNQLKREQRYRECVRKIANIFNTAIHQASRKIADMKPEFVVLEDLGKTKTIQRHPYMAKHLHNFRNYKMRNYITYKCEQIGSKIIIADRNFPSSKTCSCCGNIQNIGNKEIYKCNKCGFIMDRDINAAINLREYGKIVLSDL